MPRKKKTEVVDPRVAKEDPLKTALLALNPEGNIPERLEEAMREAVDAALTDPRSDLLLKGEEEIVKQDVILQARVAYIASYLRLTGYLRSPSANSDEAEAKARISMAFIKHAETSPDHDSLKWGRTSGDQDAQRIRDALRLEIAKLAKKQAQVIALPVADERTYAEEEKDSGGDSGGNGATPNGLPTGDA
jgi:hypothetical protein